MSTYDEMLDIATHTPIGMGDNVFVSESVAKPILDAVLPAYRKGLLLELADEAHTIGSPLSSWQAVFSWLRYKAIREKS